MKISKRNGRKSECDDCRVNLPMGYGFIMKEADQPTTLCQVCAAKAIGKQAVDSYNAESLQKAIKSLT